MKNVPPTMRPLPLTAAAVLLSLFTSLALAQRGGDSYIVILKEPPVAAAIETRHDLNTNQSRSARVGLAARQKRTGDALAGLGIEVFDSTAVLLNALYVKASADQLEALRAHPEVASVQPMRPLKRNINQALDLVSARAAWTQVGGAANAGAGVKIGILDTGIDQNHPAFRDFTSAPPAGYPKCRADNGDCAFTNNKVIVARSYVDLLNFAFGTDPVNTRPDDNTPADRIGHGTATAMVAAGQEHDSPVGRISGVAPRAFLGNYKVFGTRGVNDSTFPNVVIKALEEAAADGMDIVSLNLGQPASYGPLDRICGPQGNQPCDAFAIAIQNAVRLGMVVTASAGNSGLSGANFPSLNTVESPATAPDAIAVGASTNSVVWFNTLSVLGTGVPTELQTINMRVSQGPQIAAPIEGPIVDVGSLAADRLACAPLPDNSLAGRIALIQRGNCALRLKILHAQRAGATAAVLTNFDGGGVVQLEGLDNTGIPSALISFNAGSSLRAFLSSQQRSVRLNPAFREVSAPADEIADFSSRGPSIGDYAIKPDLVAVGTDLYMATQTLDPGGELYHPSGYTVSQGTSFSAPMVAGAAALIKQNTPNLRPAQIKSALVNNATANLRDLDNNGRQLQAGIPAMGGGKLDTSRALRTSVTVEPSSLAFGLLPQINFPALGLVISNLNTATSANLSVRVEQRNATSALTVSVTPGNIAIAPGRETQVTVRLNGTRPAPGRYDGFLVLSGGATELRVPYSFYSGPSAAWNMYALAGGFFEAIPGFRQGLLMKIVDEFGIPVRGVAVRGIVTRGNGRIIFANERTDEYGIAEATYETGQNLGEQVVRFEAGNLFADFVGNIIPRPAIATGGVRDAASGEASPAFAAGQYISIFGNGLSPGLRVFSGSELALALSRVSVSFDNPAQRVSAPGRIQFVSEDQINVQIPWECAGLATVDMKVSIGEFSSAVQTLALRAANPAPFEYIEAGSNRRYASALDASFNLISSANPVRRGQVAQLFVNGMGAVSTIPGSGKPSPSNPLARTNAVPEVRIGGQAAQVLFSGLAPGIIGLYQLNVVIPADIPPGTDVELTIQQSGVTSRASRIAVQ
ncbi:MAG: S8 family serine peptidase [Acidobacteriota bacterium]